MHQEIKEQGNRKFLKLNKDEHLVRLHIGLEDPKDLINDLNHVGLYLYTNGTYGHGYKVAENLQLNDIIDGIFARDNIPSMKPLNSSFNYVNNMITDYRRNSYEIIFFDDLLDNLETARSFGWKTVWISNDFLRKPLSIDYSFPNIYDALMYFSLKERY